MTGALGQRSSVRATGTYSFPSDWACRGFKADSLRPTIKVDIDPN